MQRFTAGLLVALVLVGASRAEVIIDADTTVDYDINDDLRVIAGANPPTSVQFVEPASVNNMTVYDDSIVNMTGGGVGGYLQGYDSATLNVSGGSFGLGLDVHGQCTLNASGGNSELLFAYDDSVVDFSGGFYEIVQACDSSSLDIRDDAHVNMLIAVGASTVSLSGDGHLSDLSASHTSVITVYGTGFNYPYGEIPDASGRLIGTLANGDPIDTAFNIHDDASIVLAPEPSTLVVLSLAVVALPADRRRKRKRRPDLSMD